MGKEAKYTNKKYAKLDPNDAEARQQVANVRERARQSTLNYKFKILNDVLCCQENADKRTQLAILSHAIDHILELRSFLQQYDVQQKGSSLQQPELRSFLQQYDVQQKGSGLQQPEQLLGIQSSMTCSQPNVGMASLPNMATSSDQNDFLGDASLSRLQSSMTCNQPNVGMASLPNVATSSDQNDFLGDASLSRLQSSMTCSQSNVANLGMRSLPNITTSNDQNHFNGCASLSRLQSSMTYSQHNVAYIEMKSLPNITTSNDQNHFSGGSSSYRFQPYVNNTCVGNQCVEFNGMGWNTSGTYAYPVPGTSNQSNHSDGLSSCMFQSSTTHSALGSHASVNHNPPGTHPYSVSGSSSQGQLGGGLSSCRFG